MLSLPHMVLPADIQVILDDVRSLLGDLYLVGGSLREVLQNSEISNDINLLVSTPLSECRRRLSDKGYAIAIPGHKHNSLVVPLKGQEKPLSLDIASFRHRPSKPPSLEEDLLHRDFTINAMAWPWPRGPLVDPFHGLDDLNRLRVHLVDGVNTLQADPLRALRFFRFAIRLAANPDPEDCQLCEEVLPEGISPERLRGELDRILSLPLRDEVPREWVLRLFRSNLGRHILPELGVLDRVRWTCEKEESVFDHTLRVTLALTPPSGREEASLLDLRWAALLYEIGRAMEDPSFRGDLSLASSLLEDTLRLGGVILERLKFSKRRQKRILSMIQYADSNFQPTDRAIRRMIGLALPVEGMLRLLRARNHAAPNSTPEEKRKLDEEYEKALRRCLSLRSSPRLMQPRDLLLSGGEILDMVRLPAGVWTGNLQKELISWVLEDPARNNRDSLERKVREWMTREENF
ncbi:MAG: CCA tRNA nucleotidyltransferase [Magnetococcales bacterium]|nr:CCA tRNA nucleotidyltransferase [Magnetococcales bacterium]